MDETLVAFLRADDLDELQEARGQITFISRRDAAALASIAAQWSDEQAIANLLMYPEVIPRQARLAALLRGLNGAATDYTTLAATVGLQRLEPVDASDDALQMIGARLLHLIEHGGVTLARRASLTIERFVDHVDVEALVRLLGQKDETVRHNVLAALLPALGPAGVTRTVARQVNRGDLDPAVRDYVGQKLAGAGFRGDETTWDAERQSTSSLGVPLLGYIPNLREWQPARQG